ncbi:ABC transporter ATP-binding protein [Pseudomarimonas arenosa]|uniref:ABC transporter ATP-binding protein n=1 Tax=Pseudomarimonas arenosa TaxID=2774145 RepID=UPI003CCCB862
MLAELVAASKGYDGQPALDGLHLAVRAGELLALLGPNGAGKTTAIGLLLGTLQPDAGEAVLMGGSPLSTASRLAVGVMMQDVTLTPTLRTREHIALAASYYRTPRSVDEVIELCGLQALADKAYGKLSTGQKRQVQFALAIVGRPQLVFLDEPSVGLDVAARETMWRGIRQLLDEGCGILLTTHYLEEAEALADRVAVLARGRLIAEGSVGEMRDLVARKRIRCASALNVEDIRRWPGVVDASSDSGQLQLTASDADSVVRRLLASDSSLRDLEIHKASLAEAFNELTREAA